MIGYSTICILLVLGILSMLAVTDGFKFGSKLLSRQAYLQKKFSLQVSVMDPPATALGNQEVAPEGTMFQNPIFRAFDFLLGIPIVHDLLFGVYRKQIVEKSEKWVSIGQVL